MPIVAWYVLSNESYMKRVMSDVLPTVVINQCWCLSGGHACPHCLYGGKMPTTLFAEEDQPVGISRQAPSPTLTVSTHLNFFSGFEYPDCAIVEVDGWRTVWRRMCLWWKNTRRRVSYGESSSRRGAVSRERQRHMRRKP
jgi:hypothetical protein